MPRQLRIEYPGAVYYVMNRGERREPSVPLKGIAEQLAMGTWTHVANRLYQSKGMSESNEQHALDLV